MMKRNLNIRGREQEEEEEEEGWPIPQITCSLIAASRCSIDTVVRPEDPGALIINCNRKEKQGVYTALQLYAVDWSYCMKYSQSVSYIILIIPPFEGIIRLVGEQQKKHAKTFLRAFIKQNRPDVTSIPSVSALFNSPTPFPLQSVSYRNIQSAGE